MAVSSELGSTIGILQTASRILTRSLHSEIVIMVPASRFMVQGSDFGRGIETLAILEPWGIAARKEVVWC